MGALDGTVTTPFGAVPKKTALIVGGGAGVLLVILYYRSKKASDAAAVAASGEATGINPATGYVYGSAEDAAALANQADYISPGGGGGGGGSSYNGSTAGSFVSNAQWSQAAIQYMTAQGIVEDASQLSAALGKYIAGSPVTAVQKSLIEQAIAFQGLPPVAGIAGYPPSINTEAVPDAPSETLTAPSGYHDTGKQWPDYLQFQWNAVPGAVGYRIADGYSGQSILDTGNVTGVMWGGLVHNGTYYTKIAAKDASGNLGPYSPILTSHTKN